MSPSRRRAWLLATAVRGLASAPLPCAPPAPRGAVSLHGPVAVGRDVPIAPPRVAAWQSRPLAAHTALPPLHPRGARGALPPLHPRGAHAHYPGGAMGTSRPTAITPARGARALPAWRDDRPRGTPPAGAPGSRSTAITPAWGARALHPSLIRTLPLARAASPLVAEPLGLCVPIQPVQKLFVFLCVYTTPAITTAITRAHDPGGAYLAPHPPVGAPHSPPPSPHPPYNARRRFPTRPWRLAATQMVLRVGDKNGLIPALHFGTPS